MVPHEHCISKESQSEHFKTTLQIGQGIAVNFSKWHCLPCKSLRCSYSIVNFIPVCHLIIAWSSASYFKSLLFFLFTYFLMLTLEVEGKNG